MNLVTALYENQKQRWPARGKHILAQFDESSIVVYQAYRPAIGRFAAEHGTFGGDFSFTRMTWIKPNFLWMMYRSGWGTKENQEVTLAVRLKREFFERLLALAVSSTFNAEVYASEKEWKSDVARSSVRLQWDPDHSPSGGALERRAIQLGLRGPALEEYAREAITEIEDISAFVAEQRPYALAKDYERLQTPLEQVFRPSNRAAAQRVGLDLD